MYRICPFQKYTFSILQSKLVYSEQFHTTIFFIEIDKTINYARNSKITKGC